MNSTFDPTIGNNQGSASSTIVLSGDPYFSGGVASTFGNVIDASAISGKSTFLLCNTINKGNVLNSTFGPMTGASSTIVFHEPLDSKRDLSKNVLLTTIEEPPMSKALNPDFIIPAAEEEAALVTSAPSFATPEVSITDWEAVHEAIKNGEIDGVSRLIHAQDIDLKDKERCTPLHLAVRYERVEVVQYLLDKGADVTLADGRWNTAFSQAICSKQKDCITVFLKCDRVIKEVLKHYSKYISLMVFWYDKEICETFVDAIKPKIGNEILQNKKLNPQIIGTVESWCESHAKFSDDEGLSKIQNFLRDVGYDSSNLYAKVYGYDKSHLEEFRSAEDICNFNSIRVAIQACNLSDISDLIEKNGVDINIQDKTDQTPLHIAARYNKKDVVQWLLEHEADATIKNYSEKTPFYLALEWGHGECVEVLLSYESVIREVAEDYDVYVSLMLNDDNAQSRSAFLTALKNKLGDDMPHDQKLNCDVEWAFQSCRSHHGFGNTEDELRIFLQEAGYDVPLGAINDVGYINV